MPASVLVCTKESYRVLAVGLHRWLKASPDDISSHASQAGTRQVAFPNPGAADLGDDCFFGFAARPREHVHRHCRHRCRTVSRVSRPNT